MSNGNREILAEFVQEAQEHFADVEADLLTIEAGGAEADRELINKVFRSVHSVKGAAGFLGLTTIGELAHSLENVLNLMRNGELVPSTVVVDVLLRAADALRTLIADAENSNGADIAEHVNALKRIIEGGAPPAVKTAMEQRQTVTPPGGRMPFELSEHELARQKNMGHHLYFVEADLLTDVEAKGKSPMGLVADMLGVGEIIASRMELDTQGGLAGPMPQRISFLALMGTVLEETELVAAVLGVPPDRITKLDLTGIPAGPAVDSLPAASGDAAEADLSSAGPVQGTAAMLTVASPPPPGSSRSLTERAPAAAATAGSGPPPSGRPAGPHPATESQADTSIRVAVSLLDRLMNLAGELVLSRNQLLQIINARNHEGLESVGSRLDQVTSELQEAIMQTRMQPIATVFNRFPRVVRDLSNKLGKQCELIIEGREVDLDKSIIEAIGDPLTHLVRNAVDHGIEAPAVRQSKGKPAVGRILLKAFHQAGKVNIAITDDGAGIDVNRLKDKALAHGLITAGQARDMNDREALRLIFHPGLSTAEKVTDVSGRGVGMDVVRTNIEKLGGTVEVESQPGQGTTILIKLPLTLAIIPSMIVGCGGDRFAIPQVSISELVRIKASEVPRRIERIRNAEVMRLRGNLLPLVRLSTALGLPGGPPVPRPGERVDHHNGRPGEGRQTAVEIPEPGGDKSGRPADDRPRAGVAGALHVIVLETGTLRYGLVVDGLYDSEEIVVKPLGRHMKGCPCLAGATILGDGRVALILDVPGIAAHCQLKVPEGAVGDQEQARGVTSVGERQTLLLFTHDPAEHFGIPMGMIARIERIRREQIDSVGGHEILQYRGTSLPLLALDNLTRARPRPDQAAYYVVVFRVGGANRELGLLAPTLVDIRTVDLDVDTQTFREPGILGSMIIDGRTTRLLDLSELARTARPDWFAGPEESATDRPGGSGGNRILVVEDSSFFRRQIVGFLTDSGYEVAEAGDGLAAWKMLEQSEKPFDLVLTDIEMPEMNGYQLTQAIKGDPRFASIPVVALTSLAGQEDIERGRAAGVDDYQVKLDREELLKSVGRLLRSAAPAGVT